MEQGIDVVSTVMVVLALLSALTAVFFGYKFSSAIGGELGGAFKWVMGGTTLFALTRVDDLFKVTGMFHKMGVNYAKVVLMPHSIAVFVAWFLITYGFYRMWRTFSA